VNTIVGELEVKMTAVTQRFNSWWAVRRRTMLRY
jgi:hypothetical protein